MLTLMLARAMLFQAPAPAVFDAGISFEEFPTNARRLFSLEHHRISWSNCDRGAATLAETGALETRRAPFADGRN